MTGRTCPPEVILEVDEGGGEVQQQGGKWQKHAVHLVQILSLQYAVCTAAASGTYSSTRHSPRSGTDFQTYTSQLPRSRIHERIFSLRFLNTILRVLRGFRIQCLHYKPVSDHSGGGGGGGGRKGKNPYKR